MTHCPRCEAEALRRSRTRSLFERVRKALTAERPHRCMACDWRGWSPERNAHHETAIVCTTPDLDRVQTEFDRLPPPDESNGSGAASPESLS